MRTTPSYTEVYSDEGESMPDPTLHIDDGLSTGMQRIGQAMVTAVIALASVVVAGWIQERIVASTFPVRVAGEVPVAGIDAGWLARAGESRRHFGFETVHEQATAHR